jgi:oxalate decarboxylase/phosphoglucose isomerase-like protein (cupin superfamily)
MKKYKLDCEYIISEFKQHDEIKARLLELISKADYKRPIVDACETNITKSDWHYSKNADREWFNYIKKPLSEHVGLMYNELNYGGYIINEIWFQQYLTDAGHGWHTHSGNFTNVYYLELPKNAPKTQLIEPHTGKIFELDVKEGDVVAFPSFVLHRAPINRSSERKTIVSFNIDATYPDESYGKGIN